VGNFYLAIKRFTHTDSVLRILLTPAMIYKSGKMLRPKCLRINLSVTVTIRIPEYFGIQMANLCPKSKMVQFLNGRKVFHHSTYFQSSFEMVRQAFTNLYILKELSFIYKIVSRLVDHLKPGPEIKW
jgi:hypothetical protein